MPGDVPCLGDRESTGAWAGDVATGRLGAPLTARACRFRYRAWLSPRVRPGWPDVVVSKEGDSCPRDRCRLDPLARRCPQVAARLFSCPAISPSCGLHRPLLRAARPGPGTCDPSSTAAEMTWRAVWLRQGVR